MKCAWRDAVDVDAKAGPFHRQTFGHARNTGFGDRIQRRTIACIVESTHARYVHHTTWFAGGDQTTSHFTGQHKRATQVGIEYPVDEVVRHLVGALGVGNAGVVDENGHRAISVFGLLYYLEDAVVVRHVHGERRGFSACSGDHLPEFIELLVTAPGDDDFCTSCGQHLCKTPAETGGGAGHQSDLAGKILRGVWQ